MDWIVLRLLYSIDPCWYDEFLCKDELVIFSLWAWWWVSSLVMAGSIGSWLMVNCDNVKMWVDWIS